MQNKKKHLKANIMVVAVVAIVSAATAADVDGQLGATGNC